MGASEKAAAAFHPHPRPTRVCSEPGCPVLTTASRCIQHRRDHEHRRGSRQERGYDADHDRLREQWAPQVATGRVSCRRCGKKIAPDARWDLGHDDDDRTKYRGPEHEACNRRTATRRAPRRRR